MVSSAARVRLSATNDQREKWSTKWCAYQRSPCTSRYVTSMPTYASGTHRYSILGDSPTLGAPQIIECGHLFCTQFDVLSRYPQSGTVLRNFIAEKHV